MDFDYSRLYSTRIKKTVDDDRLRIIQEFQELIKRRPKSGVILVNYYRGLPIAYPATIIEMDRGVLELDVHQQQAVALADCRQTFIKCAEFDCTIHAVVQSVDVRRRAVSLRNFVFIEIMAERRGALRLELVPPVEAVLTAAGSSFACEAVEISLGGCCLRLPRQWFADGVEAGVRITLPNEAHSGTSVVEAQARHLGNYAKDGDAELCRFVLTTDPRGESKLSRFMFQRQVDLIRELKERSGS